MYAGYEFILYIGEKRQENKGNSTIITIGR